jgi:hypothetical protein
MAGLPAGGLISDDGDPDRCKSGRGGKFSGKTRYLIMSKGTTHGFTLNPFDGMSDEATAELSRRLVEVMTPCPDGKESSWLDRALAMGKGMLERQAEQLEQLAQLDDLALMREAKAIDRTRHNLREFGRRMECEGLVGMPFEMDVHASRKRALSLIDMGVSERRETLLAAALKIRLVLSQGLTIGSMRELERELGALPDVGVFGTTSPIASEVGPEESEG